ncbi:TRAP transporter small permease [Microvirga massiliensis]|uniref:TRAP transporter small permease n=1 Tax=Microvirga massiliensis TaxID=1033741 RepID=UPI00069B2058|nr:TRAP transporter small permease subunit [Microvirga massiliensis]
MIEPVRLVFRVAALILLAVMIAMPAIQVVLREVIRAPFIGAEELTRFMLICVTFITFPYVVSSGANIRMEEFIQGLPEPVRQPLHVLIAGTGVIGFGIAAYSVAVAALTNLNNATPTLGIPNWIFFSAAFLGLLFAAVEYMIQFVKALRGRNLYVTLAAEQAPDEEPQL